MRKKVLAGLCAGILGLCGCAGGGAEAITPFPKETEEKQELTILHIDAEKKSFQEFISNAEKKLDIQIHVEPCTNNADNRQAVISTVLSSGDSSADIISVNDEMISEFKHKGYLAPLEDTVMTEEIRKGYPQEYLQEICSLGGHIYSVPYLMDVMVFWVNQSVIAETGMESIESLHDLARLGEILPEGKFAYGDAWETTYVYNSIYQFVNLFGGDYKDWKNPKTREAVRFMKEMLDTGVTSFDQLVDQYEHMDEKFMEGKYASIFAYTGAVNDFREEGVYGEDQIHIATIPESGIKATNIATWQYVLNNASKNKEAAVRFLQYAASKEGSLDYSRITGRYPARLDVIQEDLELEGIEEVRQYLAECRLMARPLCQNSMKAISSMGTLFQKFVLGEMEEEAFFEEAQMIVNKYYEKG